MMDTPVITIKRLNGEDGNPEWYVIIRGSIYDRARLTTKTETLGQALTVGEAHLKFWGYNEIQVTKTIANTLRNLRRRYGADVINEAMTPTQKAAVEQLEPYPD